MKGEDIRGEEGGEAGEESGRRSRGLPEGSVVELEELYPGVGGGEGGRRGGGGGEEDGSG